MNHPISRTCRLILLASFLPPPPGGRCLAAEPAAPDCAAIVRELQDVSRGGMDRRLGPDYAHYHPSTAVAAIPQVWMDLRPLVDRVRTMDFTTQQNYQKACDAGLEPQQWPYAFAVDPSWMPRLVQVVTVPQPTAVIASMKGGARARAFIASLDGSVGIYSVGSLAAESPDAVQEIQRVGEVRVGRNPTCLVYQKGSPDTIRAVSRGDREIAWFKCSERDAQVIRRLRDARLLDPVFVDVTDTHGIETPLLMAVDFHGRKLINYRYGPLVFATQGGATFGMGPDGKDAFECGGLLEIPGSPFCVSATNVN